MGLENKYILLGGILILIILILIILKYILKPKENNDKSINESLEKTEEQEQEFTPENFPIDDPNYKTECLDVDSMKSNNDIIIEKPIEVKTVSVSIKGENIGTFNISDKETIIGRDPSKATIIISEAIVSKTHLKITPEGDGFILEDLNSTNGTFINGKQVHKERITTDDKILIGKKGNILIRFI